MVEAGEVLRRRQYRHPLVPAFFGQSDVDETHAIRLAIERLPVLFELGVAGQKVVVAEVRAELLARRCHRQRALRQDPCRYGGGKCEQQREGEGASVHEAAQIIAPPENSHPPTNDSSPTPHDPHRTYYPLVFLPNLRYSQVAANAPAATPESVPHRTPPDRTGGGRDTMPSSSVATG